MSPDTLVVLSDGRDVLINNPTFGDVETAAAALQGFRDAFDEVTFQQPGAIVISAEAQCCVSALTYAKPGDYFDEAGNRKERACSSGEADCLWNGNEKAVPWENFMKDAAIERIGNGADVLDDIYLNAGLIAGKVADLLRVLQAADILATEDDQAVLTDFMYRNPEAIVLDYGQAIFGNNRGGLEGNDSCMFKIPASGKNQRLQHTKTQTTPLFVHSPGGYLQCHDDLAAQLGIKAISTQARRRLQVYKTTNCNYNGQPCKPDEKLVSGFCVKTWCYNDFKCPAYSQRVLGRDCYNNFDDCQCQYGYYKNGDQCKRVCDRNGNQCLSDEKLVSGYCVKQWCYDDFQCPTDSTRLAGRDCYNNMDNCQCNSGFHRAGDVCVRDNVCYQCPMFSHKKTGCQCKNTMDDCECDYGYKLLGGYCVKSWCYSNYQCAAGTYRIPGQECYDKQADCSCNK
jgi:hypothetical protein